MADLITVKSNLKPTGDGGHPTALWDVDPAHPNGEAFIAGPEPVQVAETGAVLAALHDRRIVKVKDEEAPAKDAPKPQR